MYGSPWGDLEIAESMNGVAAFGELELAVDGWGMPMYSDDIYGAVSPTAGGAPTAVKAPASAANLKLRTDLVLPTVSASDDDDDDDPPAPPGTRRSRYKPSKKAKRLQRRIKRLMTRRRKLVAKLKATPKRRKVRRKRLKRRIIRLNKRITAVKLMLKRETGGRYTGKYIKPGALPKRLRRRLARRARRRAKKLGRAKAPPGVRRALRKVKNRERIRKYLAMGWKRPPSRTSRPAWFPRASVARRWRLWNTAAGAKFRRAYWRKFRLMRKGRRFPRRFRPMPLTPYAPWYQRYPQPQYRPAPLPYRSYQPMPLPMQTYRPVTLPRVSYAPAQPAPRQYAPVIGRERSTSYTYTTAAQRAAAMQGGAAAADAAEQAEDFEETAEEANQGSSNLKKVGIGLLVVGGIFIVAKQAGKKKKKAKKPAAKPAFGA